MYQSVKSFKCKSFQQKQQSNALNMIHNMILLKLSKARRITTMLVRSTLKSYIYSRQKYTVSWSYNFHLSFKNLGMGSEKKMSNVTKCNMGTRNMCFKNSYDHTHKQQMIRIENNKLWKTILKKLEGTVSLSWDRVCHYSTKLSLVQGLILKMPLL